MPHSIIIVEEKADCVATRLKEIGDLTNKEKVETLLQKAFAVDDLYNNSEDDTQREAIHQEMHAVQDALSDWCDNGTFDAALCDTLTANLQAFLS